MAIDFGFHNLFTCQGFNVNSGMDVGFAAMDIGGPCSMGKFGLVILFFVLAIIRKWGGEEMDLNFSLLWASLIGLGVYFLIITFTGSMKFSFVGGLVAGIAAGYGSGYFMGDSVSSDYSTQ